MLLQEAATKLGLGITTLKRVCRSNGMTRWPFRKRNSLGRLIDRTKQVLDDGTGQDNMKKLMALQMLEKQRQVMRVGPLSLLWLLQSPDLLCHLACKAQWLHLCLTMASARRCIQHCWIIMAICQSLHVLSSCHVRKLHSAEVCIADLRHALPKSHSPGRRIGMS